VIFFGGSYPGKISEKGPSPYGQSAIWTTTQRGYPVAAIPYMGNYVAEKDDGRPIIIPGKTQQAINAQGLLPNDNVNLIAYSAGTESALMYAQWRIENGQSVKSIVLLGPTFETSTTDFDDWSVIMDYLISQGVNIYILDDDIDVDQDIKNYQAPTCSSCGAYELQRDTLEHYSEHPTFAGGAFQGTNNSPEIKKDAYMWLRSPY